MNTKYCPNCKQDSVFYAGSSSWCKDCSKAYFKNRHQEKYHDIHYRMRQLRSTIKQRARVKSLYFDLTTEDLIDLFPEDHMCPVLDVLMIFGGGEYSPSLDRIDNSKGYTKDNCMFMCRRANTIKSDSTLDELEKVYRFFKEIY